MHGVRLLFCIRASGYQGILFEPGDAFSPKGYFSRHPGQITSQRYTHDIYHGLVTIACVWEVVWIGHGHGHVTHAREIQAHTLI